jgi:hypothetical protein
MDKLALGQIFLPIFRFLPCQYYFTNAPNFIIVIILLSEEQAGEKWQPSNKNALRYRAELSIKVFSRCFLFTNNMKDEHSFRNFRTGRLLLMKAASPNLRPPYPFSFATST